MNEETATCRTGFSPPPTWATTATAPRIRPWYLDAGTGEPVLPNGTLAPRYSEAGKGRWNLDLGDIDPVLTLHGRHEDAVPVDLPRFDVGETEGGGVIRRGVPVIRAGAGW